MATIKLIIADLSRAFITSLSSHISLTRNIEIAGVCSSGIELQKLVADRQPDAVLMDAILSETDGLTALKLLKRRFPEVSYIICTEFCTEAIISRARSNGASAFICKPADRNAVIDTITETVMLERSAPAAHSANAYDRDAVIADILSESGIAANCEGYRLLRHAVSYILNNDGANMSITKQLYPELSRAFSTTAARAERNIRSAIDRAFLRGAISTFNKKPTNREFILHIAKLAAAAEPLP